MTYCCASGACPGVSTSGFDTLSFGHKGFFWARGCRTQPKKLSKGCHGASCDCCCMHRAIRASSQPARTCQTSSDVLCRESRWYRLAHRLPAFSCTPRSQAHPNSMPDGSQGFRPYTARKAAQVKKVHFATFCTAVTPHMRR